MGEWKITSASAMTSGGEPPQPDIADVTNVRASLPEAVEVDGTLRAKVTISYTAPANLGSGDVEFSGVKVRIQRPASTADGESYPYSGTGGGEQSFELLLSYPAAAENQVVFLFSQSAKYTDAAKANTPHATVAMPSNPLSGPAPDVVGFDAGTVSAATGTFTRTARWDRLNEKMLVDWGCLLPSESINWSGVAVFVRVESGECIQATGVAGQSDFTPALGGMPAHYDCIAIEGDDLPAASQNWQYIAVSYDRAGHPNRDAQGNPTGPVVIVPTLTPAEKPDFNRPQDPSGLDFTTSIAAPEQVELRTVYTAPAASNFIGLHFYLEAPAGSIPADLGSYDADRSLPVQIVKVRRPAPKQAENWKLWGVPYGTTYAARLDATCTSVTHQVSPYPYSAAVANVSARVKTDWTDGNAERYGFAGTFTMPADPVFEHCEVAAQFDGDATEIWMADEGDGDFDTSMWPMPAAAQPVTIRFYAVNQAGQKNTANVPSVRLTVQPTVGGAGQERAPLVTGFAAAVEYGWTEAGDQTYALYGHWDNPAHGSFRGAVIYCKDSSGRVYPLTDDNRGQESFRTQAFALPEGGPHTLTLYSVSTSGAGENTIAANTPQVTVTFSRQLGSQGQEYAELVTNFSVGFEPGYDEVGGQRYRMYGSFTLPASKQRYRGCKVMGRMDTGAFREFAYCAADEISFRSDWEPMPETAQTWYIYPDSVDANNRANAYVENVTPVVAVTVAPASSGNLKLTRAAAGQLGAGLANTGTQIRIPDYGISESLLGWFAVSQAKLANMQIVDAGRLVDGAVGKMKLQYAKIIDAARIEDLAVGTATIQFQAVDNSKIKNLAVDGAKIANAAVGTMQIADLQVTWAKIANLAVDNAKLGYAAVDNINIRDGVIESAKIKSLAAAKLEAGTVNVSGQGLSFSGSAGVCIMNGGGLTITPGNISACGATFKSLGQGWTVAGGPYPYGYISGPGYVDAGSYSVGGAPGWTGTFPAHDGRWVYVNKGLVTNCV